MNAPANRDENSRAVRVAPSVARRGGDAATVSGDGFLHVARDVVKQQRDTLHT